VQNANELAVVPKDFYYTRHYVKRQRETGENRCFNIWIRLKCPIYI